MLNVALFFLGVLVGVLLVLGLYKPKPIIKAPTELEIKVLKYFDKAEATIHINRDFYQIFCTESSVSKLSENEILAGAAFLELRGMLKKSGSTLVLTPFGEFVLNLLTD